MFIINELKMNSSSQMSGKPHYFPDNVSSNIPGRCVHLQPVLLHLNTLEDECINVVYQYIYILVFFYFNKEIKYNTKPRVIYDGFSLEDLYNSQQIDL